MRITDEIIALARQLHDAGVWAGREWQEGGRIFDPASGKTYLMDSLMADMAQYGVADDRFLIPSLEDVLGGLRARGCYVELIYSRVERAWHCEASGASARQTILEYGEDMNVLLAAMRCLLAVVEVEKKSP